MWEVRVGYQARLKQLRYGFGTGALLGLGLRDAQMVWDGSGIHGHCAIDASTDTTAYGEQSWS